MKPDEKKELYSGIDALLKQGYSYAEILYATADMLNRAGKIYGERVYSREKEYLSSKAHISSKYGMRADHIVRDGSPEEMYCFSSDDFVQLVDGKCYKWKDGCRACAFSGYRDTDSYRLI